ncbi:MAG: hypothetical protein LBK99_21985 [Opitutaceae bacterium]|nr:hypothetical protein [Opitutaceae bacterium]
MALIHSTAREAVNPKNGRSYHINEANSFGEPSHIDVNRPRNFDGLDKKKLPFGSEGGD